MAFWNKLFGRNKKNIEEQSSNNYQLPWIEPDQNPYNIRLLDLRPISQSMLSVSKDQKEAENALSYNREDGLAFLHQSPKSSKITQVQITFPVDSKLEDGVLYIPNTMENKWVIYYHQNRILFIRSWLREVVAIAETSQENGQLKVHRILGEFTEGESDAFTQAIFTFLIYSHVAEYDVPAPLPVELIKNTDQAGLWAFSVFGNKANIGCFETEITYPELKPLRSHSLLHLAIARGNMSKIKEELSKGIKINLLAGDGFSTLHWSLHADVDILKFLLDNGANPDIESIEGTTPLMNAVQNNKAEHIDMLIAYKSDVNKKDLRGFTALHRAAEMGHFESVKKLLNHGADKHIEASGHTALSLAKQREEKAIIELLE